MKVLPVTIVSLNFSVINNVIFFYLKYNERELFNLNMKILK